MPSSHTDPSKETQHDDTIAKVVRNEDEIDKKLTGQKAFKALLGQARLLLQLVLDYARGNYRQVPYWAIGAAGLALVYVFSPIDAIPDFIPVMGYLDDATVVAFCLKLVEKELNRYREWRLSQDGHVQDDQSKPV